MVNYAHTQNSKLLKITFYVHKDISENITLSNTIIGHYNIWVNFK